MHLSVPPRRIWYLKAMNFVFDTHHIYAQARIHKNTHQRDQSNNELEDEESTRTPYQAQLRAECYISYRAL